ncbi:hypothetical protein GCM10023340_05030 [Nocardioides marinquilinus]|uniref:HTH luxR-type domain-containing protein n=1 Tax=Nocardioides marinquilinus TaxID=1210400 RepID=A0ABP9PAX8_9ACTN
MPVVPLFAPVAAAPTAAGDPVGDPVGDLRDARSRLRRGRVRDALALAETMRAAGGCGDPAIDEGVVALVVECHLAQGELARARAGGTVLAAMAGPGRGTAHGLWARAELTAAHGDDERARQLYTRVGSMVGDDLELPWRCGSALSALRLGLGSEAADLAREQLDVAMRRGAPDQIALALRLRAITESDGLQEQRLREALSLLGAGLADRLRAQVVTDLAGLLLITDHRTEAVALLREAEAYAAHESLRPLLARVVRLLGLLGEAPRRRAETLAVLTPGERRVTALVVQGMSNREVAERLEISVKAVEGHLSKIYRKFGLGSRTGLVAEVARMQAADPTLLAPPRDESV